MLYLGHNLLHQEEIQPSWIQHWQLHQPILGPVLSLLELQGNRVHCTSKLGLVGQPPVECRCFWPDVIIEGVPASHRPC